MPKVLYGVSPIGLGHATRTIAIVERLSEAGVDVRLFSGGDTAGFLEGCGYPTLDLVSDSAPTVVGGEMKGTSLWYIRSWAGLKRTTPRTERAFVEFGPDLVVCDEEFSGIAVATRRGCRKVFISDELELGFARGRLAGIIERRVEGWYRELQRSVDLLIVPDIGVDEGNRRYVGPVVRKITLSAEETRSRNGLPSGGKMILLSLSGSSIGAFLLDVVVSAITRSPIPDTFLVVSGNRGRRVSGKDIYDLGVVLDNQNLVGAADLVVSTAGKSTQDEAASAGTPFIGVPIRHHAEQERNAASIGYGPSDVERIRELIVQRMGKRADPVSFNGAQAASDTLTSMLGVR